MKSLNPIKSSEVRSTFIDYFKKQNHTLVTSSSLVPDKDPTLLFTNAGMNQFKNLFLGLEKRNYVRAVSSQKCVRAGGKHNDLENVGFTARHHTFFEMLGNFSFGDYFKSDAIHFAWELLTKEYGIPKDRLYVTVFQNDDEAADLWHRQEGIPKDRIFRLGEKDNFWRMGETGPCGPCTEIFYDHGSQAGSETDAYKGIVSGGDRYIEIWNLVMMQFFEKEPGQMEPLPKPSVDTGAGLERLSAVLQGKYNNYDTDLFSPQIAEALRLLPQENSLAELVHHEFKGTLTSELQEKLGALRVLADHTRAIAFLLTDGVIPSNEGRGYVLRRILRRALRYQRKLSPTLSFLPPMIQTLTQEMGGFYPDLLTRKDHVLNVVQDEESRFTKTLDQGTELLNGELLRLKKSHGKILPGSIVFKLYDTFGFPVDLTRLMAQEQNIEVNETEFENEMDAAKKKAKSSWKSKALHADEGHLIQWTNHISRSKGTTSFLGYERTDAESKVIGLSNGIKESPTLKQGEHGLLVLSKTSFYAESGGQCGDQGKGHSEKSEFLIHNTTKQNDIYLHSVEIISGELRTDDTVNVQIEISERRQITSNHSATHLLHSALRKVLGSHVTQAGSLVDSSRLRFDFTHTKSITKEELLNVENLVNLEIEKALPVQSKVQSQDEAIKAGAMALFGEKYGDEVRSVKMGDFSHELCGGTHVTNTSQIRLFKIVSESGVSAGVRRIEGLSGTAAFQFLNKHFQQVQEARELSGTQESWNQFLDSKDSTLSQWIEQKKQSIKDLEKEIKDLKKGQIDIDSIVTQSLKFNKNNLSGSWVVAYLDIDDRELMAQITDQIKNRLQKGLVITLGAAAIDGENLPIIVATTKDMNPTLNAGQILKDLCQKHGGKGGGRPDFAQGAISPSKNPKKEIESSIEFLLKS